MLKKKTYLTIAGTMGSGKTTVARILAKGLGFVLVPENFADNAFLPWFYKNMPRWAFHSQTFYLTEKIRQLQAVRKMIKVASVVQDTPLKQDVFSYAKTAYLQANMLPEEYALYRKIYRLCAKDLAEPDYYIYLKTSLKNVISRIEKRRRSYEKKIPVGHIELLEKTNQQWLVRIPATKKISIDTNTKDFSRDKNARRWLVNKVKRSIKTRV